MDRNVTATIEQYAERGVDRLRSRPVLGVALIGGLGLAAAATIGVGEVAVGAVAAWAAYRLISHRAQPQHE